MTVVETPPAEALDLRESTSLVEAGTTRAITRPDGSAIQLGFDRDGNPKDGGIFDAEGRVPMFVIRPGIGRGRGRHLYEASMLESNAGKFNGWKMYVNHLSPEAKKAAGGLPRDVRDLGGRIVESWWDPSVPATERFKQGAVRGMAKPTPFMAALIDHDPEIVEASISATATGVKQGPDRTWIVEGIEDKGSVDWVTEAGAGGRVVSIMESAYEHDTEGRLALLASMDDGEFTDYLRGERPDVLTRLREAEAAEGDDEDEDEDDPTKKAAKADDTQVRESEEDDMPITPEALAEALSSEETRNVLLEALDVDSLVESRANETIAVFLRDHFPAILEEALEEERTLIRATSTAAADRRVQVERFRSKAHGLIESATTASGKPLPDAFKAQIKAKFDIAESGEPTPALNVVDEIGEDGEVTKKADDKLTEAVEAEIATARDLVAAVNPTRVRGQGPSGDGQEVQEEAKTGVRKGGLMESFLQEAGFEDPSKVYEGHEVQG
jgi:hypothetical protein